jgi:hypothetical protein
MGQVLCSPRMYVVVAVCRGQKAGGGVRRGHRSDDPASIAADMVQRPPRCYRELCRRRGTLGLSGRALVLTQMDDVDGPGQRMLVTSGQHMLGAAVAAAEAPRELGTPSFPLSPDRRIVWPCIASARA